MRGTLSLVLLTAALLSVAGVAAAQPCEPMCESAFDAGDGWADGLPALVPLFAVGLAVVVSRSEHP